jgi:hypothetical protein
MPSTRIQEPAAPISDALDGEVPTRDFQSIDDQDLELALKSVSWNARDLAQFLRTVRAG